MSDKLLLRDTEQDSFIPQYSEMLCPAPASMELPSESPLLDTAQLCKYMRQVIFPQLAPPPFGEIEIRSLSQQKPVYLFLEKHQNIMVVGKLFKHGPLTLEQAWPSAEKEYFNLNLLRNRFGMNNNCCHVVTPLGKNKELSALLVTEKAPGKVLDYYIAKAVYERKSQQLFDRLTSLAKFFVKLHRNTENDRRVSPALPQSYLTKLLDSLSKWSLDPVERATIEAYAARWWDRDEVWTTDREVIVHGDATSTNFILNHQEVTGIDLEKMKWADRCWDLGFIAAELKHHFMWRMGDSWAAEPFIGHFLWQYAASYEDSQFFTILTRKIPLYMALGLLRIARNSWLDDPHRKNLLNEAKLCLEYGLSSLTTTTPS
jgi:thiamine kinase-like enzyme